MSWWAPLATPVLRLWLSTLRFRTVGRRRVDSLREDGEPFLYALFHSDMVLLIPGHRADDCAVLVSRSQDGSALQLVLARFGYRIVRGSSSRGGVAGLLGLRRALRQGQVPTVAVDGPRGPAGTVAPGVLALARSTGAWVVPVAAVARQEARTRSWDRTRLPWPGATTMVVYGRPLRVPREQDLACAQRALSDRLVRAALTAERLAG